MKIKFLYIVLTITGIISFTSFSKQNSDIPLVQMKTATYTCPMHPEIARDRPGICPKCGMDLVEKKDKASGKDSTKMEKRHQHHKTKTDSLKMKKEGSFNDTASAKGVY